MTWALPAGAEVRLGCCAGRCPHRGRMALFGEQARSSEFPGEGGVIADALVYGHTRHSAPLSMTTSGLPLAPLVRQPSRRGRSQLGPTTSAPKDSARCRRPRSAVTRVTTSSAAPATTWTSASSPLPSAWITVTPSTRPLGTPCRDWPSRTTTTGGSIRPESHRRSHPGKNVRAAPGRSRHQPVGREPMTFAASMRSTARDPGRYRSTFDRSGRNPLQS